MTDDKAIDSIFHNILAPTEEQSQEEVRKILHAYADAEVRRVLKSLVEYRNELTDRRIPISSADWQVMLVDTFRKIDAELAKRKEKK